ncbi:hypothetical protein Tco_1118402, partial [Tanacetum coccineum]
IDEVITSEFNNLANPIVGRKLLFHEKFKESKPKIKQLVAITKSNKDTRKQEVMKDLRILDDKIEACLASSDDCDMRIKLLQEADILANFEAMDTIQKAHVKCFFKAKFKANDSSIAFPHTHIPSTLQPFDRDFFESNITMDEVKNAVWECDSDKASGLDGYTFTFVKRY